MKDIQIKKECETCKHRKTMSCPNSYYCYDTENKPYYEKENKE